MLMLLKTIIIAEIIANLTKPSQPNITVKQLGDGF